MWVLTDHFPTNQRVLGHLAVKSGHKYFFPGLCNLNISALKMLKGIGQPEYLIALKNWKYYKTDSRKLRKKQEFSKIQFFKLTSLLCVDILYICFLTTAHNSLLYVTKSKLNCFDGEESQIK